MFGNMTGSTQQSTKQVEGGKNCKFAAISCYISETVQDSTKVIIECEHEGTCDLSNGVISSDPE